jgi:hypothetical protein
MEWFWAADSKFEFGGVRTCGVTCGRKRTARIVRWSRARAASGGFFLQCCGKGGDSSNRAR